MYVYILYVDRLLITRCVSCVCVLCFLCIFCVFCAFCAFFVCFVRFVRFLCFMCKCELCVVCVFYVFHVFCACFQFLRVLCSLCSLCVLWFCAFCGFCGFCGLCVFCVFYVFYVVCLLCVFLCFIEHAHGLPRARGENTSRIKSAPGLGEGERNLGRQTTTKQKIRKNYCFCLSVCLSGAGRQAGSPSMANKVHLASPQTRTPRITTAVHPCILIENKQPKTKNRNENKKSNHVEQNIRRMDPTWYGY